MDRGDALDQCAKDFRVSVAYAGHRTDAAWATLDETLLRHAQDSLFFGDAGSEGHFVDGLDCNIDFRESGPPLNYAVTDLAIENLRTGWISLVRSNAELQPDNKALTYVTQTFHPSDRSTRVPTGSRTKVSAKRPSLGSAAVPPVAPAARAVCAAPFTSSTSMPK